MMRRIFAIAIVLFSLAPVVAAQTAASFTGKWEGTFKGQRPDGTEGGPNAIVLILTL
jgi:hypothetical protein